MKGLEGFLRISVLQYNVHFRKHKPETEALLKVGLGAYTETGGCKKRIVTIKYCI